MANPQKVCAYVRVSTDRQEELSPDSQIRLINEYAQKQNMLLTHIYTETHGISGKNAEKRPAFQEMIAACKEKSHPYDAILLWKFSRFARNIDESTYYKSILRKKCNVDVISISEPITEGMYGRLIEMVIEWSDEFYLYNLSGEVMRGMTQKALQGGYNAGVPLGYTKEKGNYALPQIQPSEAEIVKKIFYLYTSQNYTLSDIAALLNREGIRTKRGNLFETRSVSYILENPFYIGKVRWNYYDRKQNRRKASENIILSDGRHQPIIEEKQFAAAARLLAGQRQKTCCQKKRTAAASGHWLSGLLKCSNCGASLGYQKGKYPGFVCWKKGKGLCSAGNYISQKNATACVLSIIEELSQTSLALTYYPQNIDANYSEETIWKRENETLDNKLKRCRQAYLNGIDTLEEYKENKTALQKQKEALREKAKTTIRQNSNLPPEKQHIDWQTLLCLLKKDTISQIHKANALREVFDRFVWEQKSGHMSAFLNQQITGKEV